jgi:AcrR family transcriptional regulator
MARQRRRDILAAAKRVFGMSGYHDATTWDIAAAAGVSEALPYQHFPGKRQLPAPTRCAGC